MWHTSSLFLLIAVSAQAANSPVDRVVKLLTKLRGQIEDEGKKEAVTYEKYSCFCKHESDSKIFAIDKSNKRIEELDASITDLSTQIAALATKAGTLKEDIKTKEDKIKEGQDARAAELKTYEEKREDLKAAVEAIVTALETMRYNKKAVAAVPAAFLATKGILEKLPASLSSISELQLLKQVPADYKYSSDEIIAVLTKLSTTFKKSLADLDKDEGEKKHASEMAIGALINTKTSLENELVETETSSAAKTELMNEQQGMKDQETKERDADQTFLDDMTAKCEAKATAWDERSQTRAAEIKAITDAIPELEKAAGVYGVNTKLVDAAMISKRRTAKVSPHSAGPAPKKTASVGFLQVYSSESRGAQSKRMKSLAAQLSQKAKTLRSASLAFLAAQVGNMGPDHFVEVRGIIKDLINKLEADAAAEATSKSICDKDMKAAITQRDGASAAIEAKAAIIDTTEAEIKQLESDIAEKAEEIAATNKHKNEITQLRAMEKAENEEAIANAKSGVADIDAAVTILTAFYKTTLLQQSQAPKDRYDETMGDKAPETFEGTYEGKVDASKGILGILETIKSDFQRTLDTVTAAETQAEKDFTEEVKELDAAIKAATDAKDNLEGSLSTAKDTLTTAKDDLDSANKQHALAIEELTKLEASCVAGEESYKERVAHRQQEIAALKEALQILDDWKGL